MARDGVMRARKDGCGCSLCRASENNVGKRRCCHVLSDADIKVRHVPGTNTNIIDITGNLNDSKVKLSIKAEEEKIRKFMNSFSAVLSEEEIEELRSES